MDSDKKWLTEDEAETLTVGEQSELREKLDPQYASFVRSMDHSGDTFTEIAMRLYAADAIIAERDKRIEELEANICTLSEQADYVEHTTDWPDVVSLCQMIRGLAAKGTDDE